MPIRALLAAVLIAGATHAFAKTPAATPGPIAAEGCLGCHGPAGSGSGPIVALAGHDQAEMIAAMAAFRNNERAGTIMGRVARGYTEAEIAAIAAHFARLPR